MLPQRLALPILLVLLSLAPAEAGVNWWTPIGPEGGGVSALKVEPATRTVYAGTWGGDVFVSTDGGGQWQRRSRGLGVGAWLMDLAVASAPVPTVYAAKDNGLFRTTDGGITWTALDISQVTRYSGAYAVAVHPADASTIYVGAPYVTSYNGILKSTDGGAHWVEVFHEPFCSFIEDLAVDPHTPSTVYAACHQTDVSPVFKSTDGGATWQPKGSGLPVGASYLQNVELAPDPDTPGALYLTLSVFNAAAGRYDPLVYKSADGGEHWTRSGPGGYPLAVGLSGLVVAGRHRSTDGGASWTEAALLPDEAFAYAIDPMDPRVVYAGTASLGVYKSANAAATWNPASRGLFATRVTALAIDPQQPSTLYAFSPGLGLRKSLSAGSRWRRADAGLPVEKISERFFDPPALVVDPVDPSNLYIGWMRGFARSNDGGLSWTVLSPPDGCVGVNDLAIDPENPSNLYATGWWACGVTAYNCLVFRSTDAGETWTCSMPPRMEYANQIVIDPREPSWIYALGFGDRLWRSTNGGRTWRRLERGLRHAGYLRTFAVDPTNSQRLYLAAEHGLYKSVDHGANWTLSNRGLPSDHHVRSIVVDPLLPQTLYAGGTRGVYISTNGGRSWHPLNGGLPGFSGELVLDPQNPSRLYAGSAGGGLYTYDRR